MRRIVISALLLNLGLVIFALAMTATANHTHPLPLPPSDMPVGFEVDGGYLLALEQNIADTQIPPDQREAMIAAASAESGVPADLLRTLGDVESAWFQRGGRPSTDFAYGVMGLRDSDTNDTIRQAADLLGVTVLELQSDPALNVRGAAAVLRSYFDQLYTASPATLTDYAYWVVPVGRYSGLNDPTLNQGYVRQVFSGAAAYGIDIDMVALGLEDGSTTRSVRSAPADCASFTEGVDDFVPAFAGNYTDDARSPIDRVVIHIGEGTYWGGLGWFQNPAAQVSAHYFVSQSGRVGQSVCEQHTAWHAGDWTMNLRSVGIEHEGYSGITPFTEAQYQATAAIVRDITLRYRIPRDRDHIIGHYQVNPPRRANCPGSLFNWDYFMSLLGDNSHLYQYQGELTLNSAQERFIRPVDEHRWLIAPQPTPSRILLDIDRLGGNLTYTMVLKNEQGLTRAEATSSSTGRGIVSYNNTLNEPLYLHVIPDPGHKGSYRVIPWLSTGPRIDFASGWQEASTDVDRWRAEIGAEQDFHIMFERLTGDLEIDWTLRDSNGTVLGNGSSTGGYALINARAAGEVVFRINTFTGTGSYRVRTNPGIASTLPRELIFNGGFESGSAESAKLPAHWIVRNATGEKTICNRLLLDGSPDKLIANSGECAFRMRGSVGERARIVQTVTVSGLIDSGSITLNAQVQGIGVVPGADIRLFVSYLNPEVPRDVLRLDIPTGDYPYQLLTGSLDITEAVHRVRVKIRHNNEAGMIRLDDISVIWTPGPGTLGSTATGSASALPLPPVTVSD